MSDLHMGDHEGASTEDGGRRLGEPVREIDLAHASRELREDETWRREGHNAKTLVKNDGLRIVLIDMHEGARMGEHQTTARISIQVLTGKVAVRVATATYTVAAGQLLAVGESLPHDVEALEPSSFLLTLARTAEERASH